MSVMRIVTVSDPDNRLRDPAADVDRVDQRLSRLLDDMIDTMRDAPGVGLAGPQVGVQLRVFVAEVPDEDQLDGHGEEVGEGPDGDGIEADTRAEATRLYALVNPRITYRSEATEEAVEACLSIPDLHGDVQRNVSIRVEALGRDGRPVTLDVSGFTARVFQHEIDHLDGILFTDRVKSFDDLFRLRRTADGSLERVPYDPMVA